MTSSFAYSPAPVAGLTDAQVTELSAELLGELRRLTHRTTLGAHRHDVRTQMRIRLIRDALSSYNELGMRPWADKARELERTKSEGPRG